MRSRSNSDDRFIGVARGAVGAGAHPGREKVDGG